jgi:hypothetical protein
MVGVDLEKSDRDRDTVLEEPAHPKDSLQFGIRLAGKPNRVIGESHPGGYFLWTVDADCVGVEAGFSG